MKHLPEVLAGTALVAAWLAVAMSVDRALQGPAEHAQSLPPLSSVAVLTPIPTPGAAARQPGRRF